MSFPVSDSFTRADSTTTLGSNWTPKSGTWGIFNNQGKIVSNSSAYVYTFWNADAPGADHWCSLAFDTSGGGGGENGPLCRGVYSGSFSGYVGLGRTTFFNGYRFDSGSFTNIISTGSTLADNDVVRIEAQGTTIRLKLNGTQTANSPVTDATYSAAGSVGILAIDSANSAVFDDFAADNFAGASTDTQEWRGCYPAAQSHDTFNLSY